MYGVGPLLVLNGLIEVSDAKDLSFKSTTGTEMKDQENFRNEPGISRSGLPHKMKVAFRAAIEDVDNRISVPAGGNGFHRSLRAY